MKKKKLNWKLILKLSLIALLLVGTVFGIVKKVSIKTKSVSSFNFSRGALDTETGLFVESKSSLCTQDPIECQGLTITPDFDSKVTYQIFWYSYDDMYFGCTDIFENNSKFVNEVPALARYARIVIYPSLVGSDGEYLEDPTIKLYNVYNIANDLTIKVNKKQNFNIELNLLKDNPNYGTITNKTSIGSNMAYTYGLLEGASITNTDKLASTYIADNSFNSLLFIKTTEFFTFNFKLNVNPNYKESATYKIYFFDSDSKYITSIDYKEFYNSTVSVNSLVKNNYASYIVISIPKGSNIKLFGTLPKNDITEAIYLR